PPDTGNSRATGAAPTPRCRTSACGFSLDDCISLENARALAEGGELAHRVKSVESLFEACGWVGVSDAQARRFSNGGALDMSRTYLKNIDVEDGKIFRIKTRNGKFLGLGRADAESGQLKIFLQCSDNS
ncbi:MAG: tRNA pseudouridine(55) synthase TruB, partial [Clostridiales bacterium]|nr:tRNA pseudouridine(55) synthase TruB [Clostridiales bacterium]